MSFSTNEMDEIIADFITESSETLEALDQKFIGLEKNPRDTVLLNEIFRSVHTIKGAAGFLGFQQMVEVTHVAEDVLNKLRKGEMTVTPGIMDAILRAIDLIKKLLSNIKEKNNRQEDIDPVITVFHSIMSGTFKEVAFTPPSATIAEVEAFVDSEIEKAVSGAQSSDAAAAEQLIVPDRDAQAMQQQAAAPAEQQSAATPKQDEAAHVKDKEQSIRVDIDRLDAVLNLAGEIVLSRNRMMRLSTMISESYADSQLSAQLEEAVGQLDLVTTDMQLAVMKMRMQPIAKVFNKFPRMVRDMARQNNKEIELKLSGEETELDKTVIEEIGDPLVHLIRNAVDHGMETPDERVKAGKPRTGTVWLNAYQEGRHIIVAVIDDGRGMDPEVIKKSALEKGLIGRDEAARMTVRDAFNLIFIPGFSTAKKVSNISGRGVGMDVVKTNISRINGTITVDSEVGKGTKIVFRLPLTLAIIQALTVEAGGGVYGIPLSTVIENIRVTSEEVQTIEGREVIHIRNKVYPVVRLSKLVTDADFEDKAGWKYIVITGIGERSIGLLVDKLHGQEEIVMKSMGEYLKGTDGIAGACITGDGNVILILDISGLLETVSRKRLM